MAHLLWQPSEERIKDTNMYRFMGFINNRRNKGFVNYGDLYQWSIDHITSFWEAMWEFAEIKVSRPYDEIVDDLSRMPGARWFQGARLNFAENLLRY